MEIKRYATNGCECGVMFVEPYEQSTGQWVKYEDVRQALADAKRDGVREFLNKVLSFECKEIDCGECPEENDLLCGLNSVVRTYGIDEIIKKVEGL